MPVKIRISNLNGRRKVNRREIKKITLGVFSDFKKTEGEVDITFLTNRQIRALNKKYMGRNSFTDVISFSLGEGMRHGKKGIIGDIYISSDMALENARRFNSSFRKELFLYTVHGLLHLLGFGDKTGKEITLIRKLEEKFLKKFAKKMA